MPLFLSEHYPDLSSEPSFYDDTGEKNPNLTHVVFGDMHGNALKLICLLFFVRMAKLKEGSFQQQMHPALERFYYESQNGDEYYSDFKRQIDLIEFDPSVSIVFLGDELADRGVGDHFTLSVFKALSKQQVPFKTLLSNHSLEFLKVHFSGYPTALRFHSQYQSLNTLLSLIEDGSIDVNEIKSAVNKHYLPYLQLFHYSINEQFGIVIYSHAPIGLEAIRYYALRYKIPYHDATSYILAQTIDSINQAFKESLNCGLIDFPEFWEPIPDPLLPEHPLYSLWNRDYRFDTGESLSYPISFVHGHDHQQHDHSSVHSLDDELGKGFPENPKGCQSGQAIKVVSNRPLFEHDGDMDPDMLLLAVPRNEQCGHIPQQETDKKSPPCNHLDLTGSSWVDTSREQPKGHFNAISASLSPRTIGFFNPVSIQSSQSTEQGQNDSPGPPKPPIPIGF